MMMILNNKNITQKSLLKSIKKNCFTHVRRPSRNSLLGIRPQTHRQIFIAHNDLNMQDRQELNRVHSSVDKAVSLLQQIHNITDRKQMLITSCMSGGIDSCVTALLLKEMGVQVRSLFMSNWDARGEESVDPQGMCENVRLEWQDVKTVCAKYGIPHFHETLADSGMESTNPRPVRFVETYWNQVFQRMLNDYERGLTPNPDLLCNRYVKFDALFKYLEQKKNETSDHQVSLVATGHYAQLGMGQDGEVHLLRGRDPTKDQTYFLAQVNPNIFKQCIFPLGGLIKKTQVKELLAKKYYKLPERVATKKESMGICFVGKRKKFSDFLADYIDEKPGPVVSLCNNVTDMIVQKKKDRLQLISKWSSVLDENEAEHVIGEHKGTTFYTIGQCLRLSGMKEKAYVCKKDHTNNILYVSNFANSSDWLDRSSFETYDPHWLIRDTDQLFKDDTILYTKIRHSDTNPYPCTLKPVENSTFATKQIRVTTADTQFNGVAPGQPAVFYQKMDQFEDLVCVGSAIIDELRQHDE